MEKLQKRVPKIDIPKVLFRGTLLMFTELYKILYGAKLERVIYWILFYFIFIIATSGHKLSDIIYLLLIVFNIVEDISYNFVRRPLDYIGISSINPQYAMNNFQNMFVLCVGLFILTIISVKMPFFSYRLFISDNLLITFQMISIPLGFIFFNNIVNDFEQFRAVTLFNQKADSLYSFILS